MICKKCGNNTFYTIVKIRQYYNEHGEPCGSEETMGQESKTARCEKCGYRVKLEIRNTDDA